MRSIHSQVYLKKAEPNIACYLHLCIVIKRTFRPIRMLCVPEVRPEEKACCRTQLAETLAQVLTSVTVSHPRSKFWTSHLPPCDCRSFRHVRWQRAQTVRTKSEGRVRGILRTLQELETGRGFSRSTNPGTHIQVVQDMYSVWPRAQTMQCMLHLQNTLGIWPGAVAWT